MATIRQRNSKYQAIIKRKGYPTQTKSFELKRDAEKWARHQERRMDAGEWTDQTEADKTTLLQLLERYGREVSTRKRGSTAELYRLDQFKRSQLASYSVSAITSKQIAEWRDQRLQQVSSGTVLRDIRLLGHVFCTSIKEWGVNIPQNPVAQVRKPSAGKPRDRVLTDSERHVLIRELAACQNPWVKPVAIFAIETGARRGEILSLLWKDVDLQHSIAKVDGKTGPRTIPLSSACTSLLTKLPRSLDGRVFPVTIETLRQAYERAVIRSGIKDFTFHDLRHDALTRMAKLGFNILELRAISGHTSANMLQRYVSINPEDLARKLG